MRALAKIATNRKAQLLLPTACCPLFVLSQWAPAADENPCFSVPPAHSDETRLTFVTVNLKKLFEEHPKTISEQRRIDEERNQSKHDLDPDPRHDEYRRLIDAVQKLDERLRDSSLSEQTLAKLRGERSDQGEALRLAEDEIRKFQIAREEELQERSVRIRNEIMDDIRAAIAATPTVRAATLVLDSSGLSSNGVQLVVYSNPAFDRTEDVQKQIALRYSRAHAVAAADAVEAVPTIPNRR